MSLVKVDRAQDTGRKTKSEKRKSGALNLQREKLGKRCFATTRATRHAAWIYRIGWVSCARTARDSNDGQVPFRSMSSRRCTRHSWSVHRGTRSFNQRISHASSRISSWEYCIASYASNRPPLLSSSERKYVKIVRRLCGGRENVVQRRTRWTPVFETSSLAIRTSNGPSRRNFRVYRIQRTLCRAAKLLYAKRGVCASISVNFQFAILTRTRFLRENRGDRATNAISEVCRIRSTMKSRLQQRITDRVIQRAEKEERKRDAAR